MAVIRRKGESLESAARRVAIDALYAARDSGGTMHDAGEAAGDAVTDLYRGAVEDLGVAIDLLARARCTDLGTDDKSWWRAERLRLTAKWRQ